MKQNTNQQQKKYKFSELSPAVQEEVRNLFFYIAAHYDTGLSFGEINRVIHLLYFTEEGRAIDFIPNFK